MTENLIEYVKLNIEQEMEYLDDTIDRFFRYTWLG